MNTIAIIGFGSAGFAALMAIRRADPRAEVTVIDPKPFDLLHPCGLPYALEGKLPVEGLSQNLALQSMGVRKVEALAEKIDTAGKVVHARGDGAFEIPYNRAIIATGYVPFVPPLKNIDNVLGRGLYTLASLEDLGSVMEKAREVSDAIVIGGGAIGLEAAAALRKNGCAVTLLEMRDQVLPGLLDKDMAQLVEKYLSDTGIVCRTGSTVEEILGADLFQGVVAGNERHGAGLCVIAAGFRAGTALAVQSGIDTGPLGIAVDQQLRTSAAGVYAAGDCIASWSVIDGKASAVKLATSAYKQGTLAGLNACGADMTYKGTVGTFVTKVGGLEVSGAGYNTGEAARSGFDPVSGKIKSRLRPEYFPGEEEITIKIVADKNTGKIVGAQAVGEGASARINIISMALEFGISLEDLGRLEMAYCPAVSEVYDPLLRAADFAARRLKR